MTADRLSKMSHAELLVAALDLDNEVKSLRAAQAPAEAHGELTDEQIDALMPEADGCAEVNKVYVGRGAYDFDEVDAWSRPLVRQVVRAALANVQPKHTGQQGLTEDVREFLYRVQAFVPFDQAAWFQQRSAAINAALRAIPSPAPAHEPRGLSNTAAIYDALTGSPYGSDDATTKSRWLPSPRYRTRRNK